MYEEVGMVGVDGEREKEDAKCLDYIEKSLCGKSSPAPRLGNLGLGTRYAT